MEIIDNLKFENLDANDAMEMKVNYRPIIEKIRKISKSFKKPKVYRKYKKYNECNLITDVKTRWNSTFFMIQAFNKNVSAIQKTCIDLKKSFEFTDEELKTSILIEKSLAPVLTAITTMSSKHANLVTADLAVSKAVSDLKELNNSLAKKLSEKISERFTSRRLRESDILCQIVDTPMDTNIFNLPVSKAEISQYIASYLKFNVDQISVPVSEIQQDPIQASMSLNDSTKVKKIDVEDLLKQQFLSIRPTSTEIERLFSTCSYIVNPRRSKIKCDLLNALLICRKI